MPRFRIAAALAAVGMICAGHTAVAQEVSTSTSQAINDWSTNLSSDPLEATATPVDEPFGGAVDDKQLEDSFHCTSPVPPTDAEKTVLLVHGVGFYGEATYGWNFEETLTDQGYDVCYIEQPHSGRGDLTVAGQYVAEAVKLAHQRLNRPVSVIGHSAGPAATMWGLRYDDEAAAKVDDFISLAGALHGTTLVEPACRQLEACPVIAWQMHPKSQFITALHAKPLPDNIDITSIYSRSDYGIQPAAEATHVRGAAHIAAQDVCPKNLPGHLGLLADPAAHALVEDALSNPGPADINRLPQDVCKNGITARVDKDDISTALNALVEYAKALGEPRYISEPALPEYARQDAPAGPTPPGEIAQGSSMRIKGSADSFAQASSDALR